MRRLLLAAHLGIPTCMIIFQEKEQMLISEKNRKFLLKKKTLMLKEISPKYFLPYAGFLLINYKGNKIQTNNKKNKISNYDKVYQKLGVKC